MHQVLLTTSRSKTVHNLPKSDMLILLLAKLKVHIMPINLIQLGKRQDLTLHPGQVCSVQPQMQFELSKQSVQPEPNGNPQDVE